jgi:hypothetical protein
MPPSVRTALEETLVQPAMPAAARAHTKKVAALVDTTRSL